jgi:group I intron endonuclease
MKIILQNLNIDSSNWFLINKPGVYLITNLINGKKYVGSSAIMLRRLKEYLNPLYLERNLKKGNSKLLRALLKYGYSNFEFKVLEMFEHYTPSCLHNPTACESKGRGAKQMKG